MKYFRLRLAMGISWAATWRFFLSYLLLGGWMSAAAAFDISLRTSSPEGTFANVQRSVPNEALFFESRFRYTLSPNTPPPKVKMDIYFGGILPGGQSFSWIEDEKNQGSLKVVPGYVPVQRGLRFEGPGSQPVVTDWSRRAEHRFGPADELGSYFLFTIMVAEGKDPADPDNWEAHDSLFVLLRP